MTDAALPIGVGTARDWDDVSDLLNTLFHGTRDDEEHEAERATFEPDRSLAVRDGDALVAHAGAFSRDLTVPGAVVPAAHVTQVGVAPTHRRRGLLTRLMSRQLREVYDAGREPVAVLWASEAPIYPRFGYGLAAQRLMLEINNLPAGAPPSGDPAGRLRMAQPRAVQQQLAAFFERLRPERPGWSSRDDRWWRRQLGDPAAHRDGATAQHAVLHEGPDGVSGYALWRIKGSWDHWTPVGEVRVEEVAAATGQVYAELWRFLLSVDLTRTASYPFATVDEPLQHLVADSRQLRARQIDGLWARIVEVGAALAARRYAAPVDVVLDVTDPLLAGNTGRWRLTGDAGDARCARTDDPAELALDVRDLGSVFLGGPALGALADAGRVRELRPGALASASAAFGWHRAPASIEVF